MVGFVWLHIKICARWWYKPLVNPKRFQTLFGNEADKKK
jgi:hypothetical protein